MIKEKDQDLKGGEYLSIYDNRGDNWKEVEEYDNQHMSKVHALRQKE